MEGMQSYFTAPRFPGGTTCRKIPLFEVLTWYMSIVTWQKHMCGGMHFYGDADGINLVKQLGLDTFYDSITELDNPFLDICPKAFWAAGKLVAMQQCNQFPVISVDMDLMAWRTIRFPKAAVVGLNYDNDAFYGTVQRKYAGEFEGWNLNVKALNAGILAFFDKSLLEVYTNASLYFMRRMTRLNQELDSASMIFAEQKMVSLVANRLQKTSNVLFNVSELDRYRILNDDVTHLWDTKKFYIADDTLCQQYIDWLSKRALEQYYTPEGVLWWEDTVRKGKYIYVN